MNIDLNEREIQIIRTGLLELISIIASNVEDYRDIGIDYDELNDLDTRLCSAQEVTDG